MIREGECTCTVVVSMGMTNSPSSVSKLLFDPECYCKPPSNWTDRDYNPSGRQLLNG